MEGTRDGAGMDRPQPDRGRAGEEPASAELERPDEAGLDDEDEPEPLWEMGPPPMFPHPPWTVGVVLTLAVVMLVLGLLAHPLWLLGGSPFILTLGVWIAVKVVLWRRRAAGRPDDDAAPDGDEP